MRSNLTRWAAALIVGAMLACSAASAAAEPPLRVRLDGASLVVPVAWLDDADVAPGRLVTLRSPSGSATVARGGVSARRLTELVGVPAPAITSVSVQSGTDGRAVQFTGGELRDGFANDPVCPACAATFARAAESGASFFRPVRAATDDNAGDELRSRDGRSLVVRIESTAPRLPVSIALSDPTPEPDTPVRLRASTHGGSAPELTWYFGDGTVATGAAVTHAFAAGHWAVGVVAHDGTAYGTASTVVSVGDDAFETPTPRAEPAGSPRGTPAAATPTATRKQPTRERSDASTGGGHSRDPSREHRPQRQASAPTPTTTPTPSPTPTPRASQPSASSISGRLVAASFAPAGSGALATPTHAQAGGFGRRAAAPLKPRAPRAPAMESAACGMLLLGLLAAGAATEHRRARRAAT